MFVHAEHCMKNMFIKIIYPAIRMMVMRTVMISAEDPFVSESALHLWEKHYFSPQKLKTKLLLKKWERKTASCLIEISSVNCYRCTKKLMPFCSAYPLEENTGCCVVFKQQASSIHIGNQKYVKSKIIIMYTTVYVLFRVQFFTCY